MFFPSFHHEGHEVHEEESKDFATETFVPFVFFVVIKSTVYRNTTSAIAVINCLP